VKMSSAMAILNEMKTASASSDGQGALSGIGNAWASCREWMIRLSLWEGKYA
jgi:hypothetical protein